LRKAYFALALVLATPTMGPLPSVAQDDSASPAPPFDTAQFARFAKTGKARIDGTFVLKVGSGAPAPQAGAMIECYPDLPYVEWALAQTAKAINKSSDTSTSGTPSADDPRLAPYTRTTKTDSNGTFHFYRLPYGRYVMRAALITRFARTVYNQQIQGSVYYAPSANGTIVYDYSHAYFDSNQVYAGPRTPFPPEFHLVARHNTFDPRR
jgi:hypothetical protein